MPMHISSTIDTGPDRIAAMFPITSSLSLSTHSDILGILQREQDRAVALLSSSPLLSSLFVSYANQAAAIQSATPSTEAEEWKALEQMISTLQEDIDKLKPENLKMMENLEAATASLEAFRSQVASLKEVISQQQQDLDSLRADLSESRDKCNQLVKDLNAERNNFQSTISDLAVERAELKETIVQQQLEISRLERQGSSSPSNASPHTVVAEAIVNRKPDEPEDRRHALRTKSGREEKEQDEQGPRENTDLKVEKMGEEESQRPHPPALRWAVGMNNDRPRVISQEERKSVWSDIRGSYSTEEDESSAPPSIINSPVPGGTFDACEINSFPKEDPPCGSEVVDPRTPLTKTGNDIGILASPSIVGPPIMSPRSPAATGNLRLPHRKSTSQLLEAPKDVAEQVPMAPERLPSPSPSPTQPRVTAPAPSLAKAEPEKPLSLLEREELKPVTSGGGGGGGDVETIAMSTPVKIGDHQSGSIDMAREERRVDQRDNEVEGAWSNDRFRAFPFQSQMTAKPIYVPKPAPAPVKTSGWGSWGTSFLGAVADAVGEVSPSPSPLPVKSKIVDPTRGYTPNTLPVSQPGGWNKPVLGASSFGDNTRGVATDNLRDTALESGSGSTPGLGTGKSVTVDTTTKLPESHPNTTVRENIPGSAVEVKHGPGWFEISAPSLVKEKVPEQPAEETELPAKETPNPEDEEEFDWANAGKKKKNRGVTSSVPGLYPDPDNMGDLPAGGAAVKKKKKKGKK